MTGYRAASLACPRCRGPLEAAGSAQACRACRGLWVEEAVLADMLARMTGDLARPVFDARHGTSPPPCPVCQRMLAPVWTHGVPLDRCGAQHGIWFDADELETVLHHAGTSPPAPPAAEASRGDVNVIHAILDLFDIFT